MEDPKFLKEETPDGDLSAIIELAQDTKKLESEKDVNYLHVRNFIRVHNVREGRASVSLDTLYKFYERSVDYPLTKIKFHAIFVQFFKRHNHSNYMYFKLDPESVGLPYDYTLYGELKKKRLRNKRVKNKNKKPKSTEK